MDQSKTQSQEVEKTAKHVMAQEQFGALENGIKGIEDLVSEIQEAPIEDSKAACTVVSLSQWLCETPDWIAQYAERLREARKQLRSLLF